MTMSASTFLLNGSALLRRSVVTPSIWLLPSRLHTTLSPAFSAMLHPFLKPSPYNKFYSQLKPALDIQFREAPDAYILFVGDTDFYYGTARRFDRYLTRKGYPHDLVITKGGHEWYNWTAYYCMLARKAFRD